jgi:uncharacterized membrane protein (DUF106 family)
MSKTVDEKKRMMREDYKSMFVEYFPKIVVMIMTGYFTWHAAWFLTANYYMSAFTVALAEGFWLLWQYLRDEDAENEAQTKNARIGWYVSIAFVAITDVSSGVIMAHNAGFAAFATIPAWAEIVPAFFIPLMAVVQGVIVAIYTGNSDSRVEFMAVRREIREARNTERMAQADADKQVAISNAERTKQLAKEQAPAIGRQQADEAFTGRYGTIMALDTPVATIDQEDTTNPTQPKRSKK